MKKAYRKCDEFEVYDFYEVMFHASLHNIEKFIESTKSGDKIIVKCPTQTEVLTEDCLMLIYRDNCFVVTKESFERDYVFTEVGELL